MQGIVNHVRDSRLLTSRLNTSRRHCRLFTGVSPDLMCEFIMYLTLHGTFTLNRANTTGAFKKAVQWAKEMTMERLFNGGRELQLHTSVSPLCPLYP